MENIKETHSEYFYTEYFKKYESLKYYNYICNSDMYLTIPFSVYNRNKIFFYSYETEKDNLEKLPSLHIQSKVYTEHSIHFFKIRLFNLSVIKSYHYIKNKAIMINLLFSELSEKDRRIIVNLIKGVYVNNINEGEKLLYKDIHNQHLLLENHKGLSISYMPFKPKAANLFQRNETEKSKLNNVIYRGLRSFDAAQN